MDKLANENNIIKVSMPGANEQATVHAGPNETLEIEGVELDDLKIDILGPDIIMSDLAQNAKLIFPGLALILFSEEEAPELIIEGDVIDADILLSKIGSIQNITQKDFLSFTSLVINPEQGGEEDKTAAPEANEQQTESVDLAVLMALTNMQPQRNAPENEDKTSDADSVESLIESRSTLTQDAVGAVQPVVVQRSDESSAAASTQDNPDISDSGVRTAFDYDIRLMQLQSYDDTGANAFEGGGGTQLSAFNPSNSLQYSTDTIDTISNSSITTIYADDPNHFNETTAARIIQLAPNLPNGFRVTEIHVSLASGSFPTGFDVKGLIEESGDNLVIEAAGSDGSGGFTISNPAGFTLNALGNLDLLFTYTVGSAAPLFQVSFDLTAVFDTGSGYPTPAETTQNFEYLQKFIVQDVNNSTDLDVTDGADTVFVLSTLPNANIIRTSDSDMQVYGGRGDDSITTGDGDDVIHGTLGDDTIDGGGNGVDSGLNAQGDIGDTLDYSAKAHSIDVDMSVGGGTFNVSIDGGTFNDTVRNIENITGSMVDDTITGDNGDNILRGDGGDDTLMGKDGDDTLDGGSATETNGDTVSYAYVVGGTGVTVDLDGTGDAIVSVPAGDTDTLIDIENIIGTDFDDTFLGSPENNILDGGAGTDTVRYDEVGVSGIVVDLGANGLGDGLATSDGSGGQDVLLNIENVIGTDGVDSITGDDGDNVIQGGLGDDFLDGSGTVDTDTLSFSDLTAGAGYVTLDLDGQTADYSGDASQDTFQNFERYILTAQDDLVYNSAGDDVVDAGGGTGDTIDYSRSNAVIVNLLTETASDNGGGADIAIGNDQLTGFENVVGSAYADDITGNASGNVLDGGDGDDTMYGAGGNDTLDGGLGTNTLSYSAAAAGVTANLATGMTTTDGDGGQDSFSNFQNLTGSANGDNLTGDGNDNVINGQGGNDTITGGAGNDTLNGDAGDDIFWSGIGTDVIDGGTGTNDIVLYLWAGGITVDFTDLAPGIQVTDDGDGASDTLYNIETIYGSLSNNDTFYMDDVAISINAVGSTANFVDYTALSGSNVTVRLDGVSFQVFGASGSTQSLSVIQSVLTGNGDDTVYGSGSADTINVGSGDNYVYGSNGADIITFGAGNDTLDYSNTSNAITAVTLDNNGDGTITRSGIGQSQTVTGVENIIGSSTTDTLTGNNNANLLAGYDGNDTLDGGLGDDFLDGGNNNDTVNYQGRGDATNGISFDLSTPDASLDPLGNGGYAAISLSNGAVFETDYIKSVEYIYGTDTDDSMTGDNNTNRLYGNAGVDTINGGGGTDYLYGGLGADIISGGTGNDWIYGQGDIDTINGDDGNDWIYGGGGDDIISGGAGADTIYGQNQNDTINGDDGNDQIYGGNGDDIISGGADADTIYGEAGIDTIDGDDGNDTIDGGAGNDIIDGGLGTDTLTYINATSGVDVDLSTGIVADDGESGSDTILGGVGSIENVEGTVYGDTIVGDAGDNVLNGYGGTDILIGGDGIDTLDGGAGLNDKVDYSSEAGPGGITVDLGAETATDTYGNDEFVIAVEHVVGTAQSDSITGSSADNTLEGGASNDTFYGSDGSDTIKGQGGTGDSLDYSSWAGTITGGLIGSSSSGSLLKSDGGTDNITGVEDYILSGGDDALSITTDALSAMNTDGNTIDGDNGTDTITIAQFGNDLTDLDVDGDTMASVFSDIEEIDLSNATVNGGDDFDLTESDVLGIVGAGGTLTLTVASGFSLNLDDSGDAMGNLFAGVSDTFSLTNGTTVDVQVV